MNDNMKDICKCVKLMDKYLHKNLHEGQLWEDTYICKQIEKRENGGTFTIQDHIRGMVYSMLSSGAPWERLEKFFKPKTRQFSEIDEIFCDYEPTALLKSKPEKLYQAVENLHCGSQYTKQQIKALIENNIGRFQKIEKKFGSVDNFCLKFAETDSSLKTLVLVLSAPESPFKMVQMGSPLTAEYLKNVGFDIAKPDRHIRRILGSNILGCSDEKEAPIYEVFDIVAEIADEIGKPIAEVDYILWSYCASGYGKVCVKQPEYRKCGECVAKSYCKYKNLGGKNG